MKRIFIFSEYYYPDQNSSSYYITEIAEYLGLRFEVHVICTSNVAGQVQELKNGVHIIRVPDPNLDKNNLILRVWKFLLITKRFYQIGIDRINSDDQIICLTNPAFSIIKIARLKRRLKCNLTVLVHDVFPDNLVGSRILIFKGIVFWILDYLFRQAYKSSNRIIVVGRDMKEHFFRKLKNYSGDIIYVPNWGKTPNLHPKNLVGNGIFNRRTTNNGLVFQFSGNIGRAQNIMLLLDAFKQISHNIANVVFYGDGAYKARVQDYASLSPNIEYGGVFSRNETINYMNICDIGLVSLHKGMKGLGVPSKTYDLMSAGKPILFIGPKDSEIAMMINEGGIGWVVSPNSVKDVINTIEKISNIDISEIERMGISAKKLLIEKYSRKHVLSRYDLLFSPT